MPYKDPEKQREANRRKYRENKQAYYDRNKKNRPALREKGRQFVIEYLNNNPCVDCGISDIRVLQFDHRDRELKTYNIGTVYGSMGVLLKEIEKCDVRCANCHMIRTADQIGWSRTAGKTVAVISNDIGDGLQ